MGSEEDEKNEGRTAGDGRLCPHAKGMGSEEDENPMLGFKGRIQVMFWLLCL
jgi:hypothetical protein